MDSSDPWFYRDDSPEEKPSWRDTFSDPIKDLSHFWKGYNLHMTVSDETIEWDKIFPTDGIYAK